MKADKQTEEEIKETRRFFQPGRIKRLKVWTRTRQAACRTIARYTRGGIAAGRKQPDEGKDDDNRDMETAFGENNNRESTPGTRPKGKNVGRVARRARKQLFFSPGLRRCCSLPSSTCTRSTARWTALSFSLSFRSYFFLFFLLSSLSRCATNQGTSRQGKGKEGGFVVKAEIQRARGSTSFGNTADWFVCRTLQWSSIRATRRERFYPKQRIVWPAGDRKCRSSRRIGTVCFGRDFENINTR